MSYCFLIFATINNLQEVFLCSKQRFQCCYFFKDSPWEHLKSSLSPFLLKTVPSARGDLRKTEQKQWASSLQQFSEPLNTEYCDSPTELCFPDLLDHGAFLLWEHLLAYLTPFNATKMYFIFIFFKYHIWGVFYTHLK